MESLYWLIEKFKQLPSSTIMNIVKGVALFVLVFFPLSMFWIHKIDDNLGYTYRPYTLDNPAASEAVSVAASLIHRETEEHRWTSNDPIFMPGAWLERMPAYQAGIISALSRFAQELSDQIGRARGSSQLDPDLDKAAGLLKYSPTVWVFDFSTSIIPTTASDKQYQAARDALLRYNVRLTKGSASFERRADNLMQTLERISSDIGSASAAIDSRVAGSYGTWYETDADHLYYDIKGRMYAYAMILRALKDDFEDVIVEKKLEKVYEQMLTTFDEAARLNTFWVFNAEPDSQFFPNHLAAQGFYVLRARTQLKEITNILMN